MKRTLRGHAGAVWGVGFLPGGGAAVSVSEDRTLKVWDLVTGAATRTLTGHTDTVRRMAVTPDGRVAFTCGLDGTVRSWDLTGGTDAQTFSGHTDTVRSVALSPDGRLMLSASWGGDPRVRLWDVATRRQVRTFPFYACAVALSADAAGSATAPSTALVALAGGVDGRVWLWEPLTGRTRRQMVGHTGPVTAVAFAPGGARAATVGTDGTLRLWDLASGEQMHRVFAHEGIAQAVAFSPDGTTVVTAGDDFVLRVWDVARGAEKRVLRGHREHRVTGVAFLPDGRSVLSTCTDQTLRLWELGTDKPPRLFGSSGGHRHFVFAVALTADGRTAATASGDGTVRLWDVASGRELAALTGHEGSVYCVAFAADGRSLVSGGTDRTLRRWDFGRPQRHRQLAARLGAARQALDRRDDDPVALGAFGEWYAFRGMDAWAVDFLERARRGGADVPAVTLARCYWRLGMAAHARREFLAAADASATEPAGHADYLALCAGGLDPGNGAAAKPLINWDKVLDDLSERGRQYERRKQWALEADAHDAAVRREPADPARLDARGRFYLMRGQFERAAADYRKALAPGLADSWCLYRAALVFLYVGDVDSYNAAASQMLGRFGGTERTEEARRTVVACLLRPERGDDPERLWALAQRGRMTGTDARADFWFQRVLSMAAYRRGDFQACLDSAEACRAKGGPDKGMVRPLTSVDFYAAMALHRSGRPTEARALLDRAIQVLENDRPESEAGAGDFTYDLDWVTCHIARREAEALVRPKRSDGAAETTRPATRPATGPATEPVTGLQAAVP